MENFKQKIKNARAINDIYRSVTLLNKILLVPLNEKTNTKALCSESSNISREDGIFTFNGIDMTIDEVVELNNIVMKHFLKCKNRQIATWIKEEEGRGAVDIGTFEDYEFVNVHQAVKEFIEDNYK